MTGAAAGANVLLGDGFVRLLGENTTAAVLRGLITRNGGETVDGP